MFNLLSRGEGVKHFLLPNFKPSNLFKEWLNCSCCLLLADKKRAKIIIRLLLFTKL